MVTELAKILLLIEAHGDYAEAQRFIDSYSHIMSDTEEAIERLTHIPTDLDLSFNPIL